MNSNSEENLWIRTSDCQARYEAALGAFLVAFNDVEASVYAFISVFLAANGLKNFAAAIEPRNISTGVTYLRALEADFPKNFPLKLDELKMLVEFRNHVAHGNYRDDLTIAEDGELQVSYLIKPKNEKKTQHISPEMISKKTLIAKDLYGQLIQMRASLA